MPGTQQPDPLSLNFAEAPRIVSRTLVLVRWIAIAGQIAALFVTHYILGIEIDRAAAAACVGSSVLVNMAAMKIHGGGRISAGMAALYLGYDTAQLATLLFLTGGLHNPFMVLMIAPLTVAASLLNIRYTAILAGLTLAAIFILYHDYRPLPWPESAGTWPTPLYEFGSMVALALSAVFIAVYVWRTGYDAKKVEKALHAAQLALLRQQRISALGAQAAAAAHELGSPLNTIYLIARELEANLSRGESLPPEDIRLLASQAERCRAILRELSNKPEADADAMPGLPPLALMEVIAQPHRAVNPVIKLDFTERTEDGSTPPILRPSPELIHGLGNLVQNAIEHALTGVRIEAITTKNYFSVLIQDDGNGFSSNILSNIGEPYISTKRQAGNMGLGLFISKSLLEMTGARLAFGNADEGGAFIRVTWSRGALPPLLAKMNG